MEIVTVTRTRNEASNVQRFCDVYGRISDRVIVVDGGSTDDTVSLAKAMPKTEVYYFNERVERNGLWRNPHGKHINACIELAKLSNPDWIIFDDCDSVPNDSLVGKCSVIPASPFYSDMEVIRIFRMYMYGETHYYPDLSWHTSNLWAWNPNKITIKADETDPWAHKLIWPDRRPKVEYVLPPSVLLHHFAPDESTIKRKVDFYVNSGQHHLMKHPTAEYGPPIPLKRWMGVLYSEL